MQYLNLLLFIFANGDRITDITKECFDKAKEFIDQLVGEFDVQAVAMDEAFFDGVADRYAAEYPEVLEACNRYASSCEGDVVLVGSRGAFFDFIRFVLENKDSIVELVKLIQSLFGVDSLQPREEGDQ